MKVKEILKLAGVSALALGLFSGAFLATNHIAFAQVTSNARPITPIETQATTNTTSANALNIDGRQFNIERASNWHGHEVGEVGANSILMEVAAQIGIIHLERYFEVNLEGRTVHMVYFGVEEPQELAYNEFRLGGWRERGDWRGIVLPIGATLDDSIGIFSFEINGETGEVLGIERNLSADTVFARGMGMDEGFILESRLIFETNPHLVIGERGSVFFAPDAPLDASMEGIFEPFTTDDSIVYANYAMQLAEKLGILGGDIARARVMLDRTSAQRVLNADLELSAVISAHVQCVNGNDAVIVFTMQDKMLTYMDFGRHLTFPVMIGGNDEHGNPIETITKERDQPTRFGWVYR